MSSTAYVTTTLIRTLHLVVVLLALVISRWQNYIRPSERLSGLTTTLVLYYYDPEQDIVIEIDISDYFSTSILS
jgi:hypothetical protein